MAPRGYQMPLDPGEKQETCVSESLSELKRTGKVLSLGVC